jgi:MYXO-CTERM domain-containing protein
LKRLAVVLASLVACAPDVPGLDELELSEEELAATVCGSGPTVKGIDVSYYQGTIDWAKVRDDGVRFAFIRVSDGLNTIDSKFETYWAGSRAAGIHHGAYQFFRPNQDPIAQANLLLSKIGTLEPDDLPPVIDVESDGGLAPAQLASKVKQWVDHVTAAIGRPPIIYTGFYFWRDEVGAPAFGADHPLWHAQYTSAACPNIPPPWEDWAFWQYTDTGRVAGISGNVDVNRFNGTYDQLVEMLGPVTTCKPLPLRGGIIDDGDPCFTAGGPPASLRRINDAGAGNDLIWTYATDSANEANYARWSIALALGGRYRVDVYTDAAYARTKQARYVVRANGVDHEIVLDQTAADGWQTLGELEFAAGGDQWIQLGDNTGEPLADKVQVVFDAIRLTALVPGKDGKDRDGDGDEDGDGDAADDGGCSTTSGQGGLLLGVALLFALRRRR